MSVWNPSSLQLPPAPIELIEWAERTLYFASMGGVAQGMLQYVYEKRGGGVGTPEVLSRAQAEYKRDSLGRISQACLRGVLRFGGISALYFGTELAAGIYRARRDYYNATYGGLVTGACSGAVLARRGGVTRMGKGLVLGCALGGAIGFPAGLIQDAILDALPKEEKQERQYRIDQMMTIACGRGDSVKAFEAVRPFKSHDPVGYAIAHLEETMQKNAKALSAGEEDEQSLSAATHSKKWSWWQR